jgi:hypothetical protein
MISRSKEFRPGNWVPTPFCPATEGTAPPLERQSTIVARRKPHMLSHNFEFVTDCN